MRQAVLRQPVRPSRGDARDLRHQFRPHRSIRIPERIWKEGPGAAKKKAPLGPPVLNLSVRGREWAERLKNPVLVFTRIAEFINSAPVQDVWAPEFGKTRELPVPIENSSGAMATFETNAASSFADRAFNEVFK
jgi:hypothetical protein